MRENNFLDLENRKLFFENWLRLLSFVNDKYDIIEGFNHPTDPVGLNLDDVFKIREKLWDDVSIIDEYLQSEKLDSESFEIVSSWKKFIHKTFVIIRQLKKHCIFLDDDEDIVYGVKGISNPIGEHIPRYPFICEVFLIPFKDKIVYDTFVNAPYMNVSIVGNMKKGVNDKYIQIKKEKGITTRLE